MPGARLSRPRIVPLPLADWDPELRARFEKPGGLGRILNVMGTLANHPAPFRPWGIFANHCLFKSTLTARAREIVILRTAWLAGCAYEWGQHLEIAAADAVFGEPEFSALAEGAAAPLWRRPGGGRRARDVVCGAANSLRLAMAPTASGGRLGEGSRGFRPGLPMNGRRP